MPDTYSPDPPVPLQNYNSWGDPLSPGYIDNNMTTITTPGGTSVMVHKNAADAFSGFLRELEGTGYKINTIAGQNTRPITGGTRLSPHSYGIAIDVNAADNPYTKDTSSGFQTNLPPNVGQMANKYGLSWGGDWKSLKDPMHFEYTGQGPEGYTARHAMSMTPVGQQSLMLGGQQSRIPPLGGLTPEDEFVARIRDLGEQSAPGSRSFKGAMGRMQVMPETALRPGFGVTPARDLSENELNRVGQDYAKALLRNYGGAGSPAAAMLASAAYNAGPQRVDQWIRQFGDPRTGQISPTDWAAKVPIKETRDYMARVTGGDLGVIGPRAAPGGGLQYTTPDNPLVPGKGQPSLMPDQPDMKNLIAMSLLSRMLPSTHGFQPVPYNPFVTPQQKSDEPMPAPIPPAQLHNIPSGKQPQRVSQAPGASTSVDAGMRRLLGDDVGQPQLRGRPPGAGSSGQYG